MKISIDVEHLVAFCKSKGSFDDEWYGPLDGMNADVIEDFLGWNKNDKALKEFQEKMYGDSK